MPYTLTKGLLWFALALLLGIVIGWLLRSIRATGQLRAARHARHDSTELERLRGRPANVDPAMAERDRLEAELAAVAGTDVPVPVDPPDDAIDSGTEAAIDGRVPADEPPHEHEHEHGAIEAIAVAPSEPEPEPDPLTAVDGIDPATAELCRRIGIHGLADLATTEVSLLRTMLADAGPPFDGYQPDGWPEQAALLVQGDDAPSE